MPALQGFSIRLWRRAVIVNVDNLSKPARVGDALVMR
jgi:hypothetical protein